MKALKIGKNISSFSKYSCQPKTKNELIDIIKSRMDKDGPGCDLNDIDTSLIEDMSYLFAQSKFNGNISDWDVSKVKDMMGMFYESSFNKDISNWNINRYCSTTQMFFNCPIKKEYKPELPR